MGKQFIKDYQVTYYDCDAKSRMKLSTLLNVVIYFSGIQSEDLNRSDEYVHSLGVTWVVTNHEIEIKRLPKKKEKIVVITEAKSYNRYFCYRDFTVQTADGEELVVVHSTFALMDIESRKMASVTEEFLAPYESEKTKKINRPLNISLEKVDYERDYPVRFSELDVNHHVNNAKYIDWLLDVLGYDFLIAHTPRKLSMRYVREIEEGTIVKSTAQVEGLETKHQISVDGVLHTEALIEWRRENEI
ncbi:medium-chain acyl-[acyl-carrier-protein] hydrolase [Pilibacter termitis]|uniref:Medium-chain acyl-[acyl-carrier-protein] hydrolase n=1 Tax=Pilibacter termitis TaxID=263852 RepID=A0A1T4NLN6_9ENTE|nr:acyl-ACP thioesterase domain-containing protein [Pilibacter termitis]SJZ80169.1 medium-chain acyl-[acyl-carrier-protein] hydrolase [Pilibacter termitis]